MVETREFLRSVITTPEGWFCLAVLTKEGKWQEEWHHWPEAADTIAERATKLSEKGSVYFSAHLFSEMRSTRENVLPSRTIQADLDYADYKKSLAPTVLVETSPKRHQGYWILKDKLAPSQLEKLSKQLTYSIPDCDKGCWQLGHKMRLPGTLNHKYADTPPVTVKAMSLSTYPLQQFNLAPASEVDWIPQPVAEGPRELLARIKKSLPSRVIQQFDHRSPDRSTALWALMLSTFRLGLSRDEVFHLAKASANNKYADSRYNADRDLARDVLRAERAALHTSAESARNAIMEVRKSTMASQEKRFMIANIVLDNMKVKGTFISTQAGEYFVREDNGRPLVLGKRSEYLNSYLEDQYGLNATEGEQHYTVEYLHTHSKEHGRDGRLCFLSYYDATSNSILLHTGRRDLLNISRQGKSEIANGQLGILFPWSEQMQPFAPNSRSKVSFAEAFGDCFDNVQDMEPAEAMALLRSWFMFLFFRDAVISRPILSVFGQPGSGKSTLFRRLYAVIYGGNKALNSITSAEEFDFAVATDPIVVFDNVDTWSQWLPDKLALSASTSDLVKRKLYTDSDTVVLRRQALVGLTAHNPKFRREDIVDRLLILNLKRLEVFKPETELLEKTIQNRDQIWAGIIDDLQKVLAQPLPDEKDVPKFRISDFARIGLRIARALGFEKDFTSALSKNVSGQASFNLEEESVLVETLSNWFAKRNGTSAEKYYNTGELWSILGLCARDSNEWTKQFPKSLTLSRKLWALQDSLKTQFTVDYITESGQRLWRFDLK